jgi:N-acetylneuraminic acid mutarotase
MRKNTCLLFFLSAIFCKTTFAQSGTWMQKASLPDTARLDAMAFAIGTKGYVTQGGDANMDRLHTTWEYDAANNTWTHKNNFSGVARWQGVSFSVGTKGYIGTGQQQLSGSYNNDLWEYDPSTDAWTQKATMPTVGRNMPVGFSIGAKGYVGLGASQSNGVLYDFWEYDPSLNSWTQKANFPAPSGRMSAVGLGIGSKGYVGTGWTNTNTYYNDWWEYDPALDTWTQKTNFPGGTREEIDGAHFVIGNFGYIGTGRTVINSSWVYYQDFWRYDALNDVWAAIPTLPAAPRIGASAFTINNIGYVGLGDNGNTTAYNDLYSFTPNPVMTSTNEIENENLISIYPNPSTGVFTLKLDMGQWASGKGKNCEIEIYNCLGEIIFQSQINNRQSEINLSDEPNGIYFVNVKSETQSFTQKIVIEK